MKNTIFILLLLLANHAFADSYSIHAGKLFDSVSAKFVENKTIRVADGKIIAVEDGYKQAAENERLIDLSDSWVIPGLMDMHVHLDSNFGPGAYVKRFTSNPADLAFESVVNARLTLEAGFTTVRNPGDSHNVTIALRNAINKGLVDGPRIFTAGKSLAVTGGHADPTNGFSKALMGDPGPKQGVINGIADARKAVRQRYKDGADVIKVTATGGMLSVAKNGRGPHVAADELEAIVDTAKDYEMVVAAHAHGLEGIKRAIRAGVDSIEHGTELDKEGIRLMKKHGTYLVPTLMAPEFVIEKAKVKGFFPKPVQDKINAFDNILPKMLGRAYKAGVNIAFGTDSGVSAHGENAREFALMVNAGMKPEHALQSATINTARLLRIEDETGSIEAGKLADIVAVKSDPIADITQMQNISFVMKQGKIYKQK